MNYQKRSLQLHKKYKGKIEIKAKVLIKNKNDLSIAYTPGVAEVSKLLKKNPSAAYTHSIKANTILVVSDGSAVLGLGNIGPLGALPVMEGKALLFKTFGNVDAFPICLDTQNTEEIIKTIKNIAPAFGGINLEDISAPRCFEIEGRLKKELSIPVFHDDQHGTAIVVLAALLNALIVTKKKKGDVKIVINGAGSAAQAIFHLLVEAGFLGKNIVMLDSKGIISQKRDDLDLYKQKIAKNSKNKDTLGGLKEAIIEKDIFIGVSVKNILTKEMVSSMNSDPIVFAMANPDPEIAYKEAIKTKIAVFGTGRSDYPNQINNVLAFPGIFRGVLDARIEKITDKMKIAAAYAIASLIPKSKLRNNYIIPNPFDKRIAIAVAKAIVRTSKLYK